MAKRTKDELSADFQRIFRDPERDESMTMHHQTWLRNILYYLGEQWLSWFQAQATFGRRYSIALDIPTPVANAIRDHVRSMIALTTNKKYKLRVWPNSNEQTDRDAAKMAEAYIRHCDVLNAEEVEDTKEILEMWRHLTGNAFCRSFIDDDVGKYTIDAKGNPIPRSEIVLEALLPFNVVLAPLGLHLWDKAYVGIKSLRYREEAEDTFKVKLPPGESGHAEVDYQKTLMKLVANVSPWKGRTVDTEMLDDESADLVLFKELEYRPTRKYPRGYYSAMLDGQIVKNKDRMPIPTDTSTGNWFYSLTHFGYNRTPGSFWCSGSVDDLISPQNTINEVDQALSMNRKSLGRPWVLTPANLYLKRVSERGNHLLQIKYDPHGSAMAKPQVMPGMPYPQQVLEERTKQREVIQDAGGDPKNILRGHSPHSGASGVMVDILREAAESAHSPDVGRFHRAWNRVNIKRLVLAQNHLTSSQLLKIPGLGNSVYVTKFKAADLRNNTDVRLELDSGLATTKAGQNEFFMRLIQHQFWGDISQHPNIQRELMKRFGMSGFPDEQNLHRDRAEYENSMLVAGMTEGVALPRMPVTDDEGAPMDENILEESVDPVFRMDDHMAHMEVHDQLIFSRQFRDLDVEVQTMVIAHRDMHEAALQAEMDRMKAEMQDMQMQAEGEQPPGAEGGGEIPGAEELGMGGGVGEEMLG